MRYMERERNRVYFRSRPSTVRKLTAATRAQIDFKLTAFAETGAGDVKALKGVTGMRLRVGDWRVLFTIRTYTITIHAVGHRRDIYD
jgi:mRNA interferase RelE/StbE